MFQIQPCCTDGAKWMQYAVANDLYFEPLEIYMPPMLGDREKMDTAAAWYRQTGRVRSLHGAFVDVNPASGDPEFRALSRTRCEESCRMAKALGASAVVLHSSCFPFIRGGYLDFWAATSAEYYRELAHRCGLSLFIENSPDVDPAPLEELMRRAADPMVQVCLDIGHAQYSNAPVEEWFDRLGNNIGYLHLSDNRGAFDDHMALGTGCIDWVMADKLWHDIGAPRRLTIEVGGLAAVEKSLLYLRENHLFMQEEET